MNGRTTLVPILAASILAGCAADPSQDPVGRWQYDRLSLRELAVQSAIDSVSKGESPTPEELAEAREWAIDQHEQWNKTLAILPDATYIATSQIAQGRPETITGTWALDAGVLTLTESDGQTMATGRIEGGRLVLELTDDEGVKARMVMLPVDEADR